MILNKRTKKSHINTQNLENVVIAIWMTPYSEICVGKLNCMYIFYRAIRMAMRRYQLSYTTCPAAAAMYHLILSPLHTAIVGASTRN
jgi:hypothetical protein